MGPGLCRYGAVLAALAACWMSAGCRANQAANGVARIGFVSIPAGKFMMGCSSGDDSCWDNERPAHQVEIVKGFEMSAYEVTQAQWVKTMEANPGDIQKDVQLPVEGISWYDAQDFVSRLNSMKDGYHYRLPTEAEWEYAARAGTAGPRYGDVNNIAWYESNSAGHNHPPGQKQPNAFGLYDMIGNVSEWCSDWYSVSYYGGAPAKDPQGPPSGRSRVVRGGSRLSTAKWSRSSFRYGLRPDIRSAVVGVRVCRDRL